MDSNSRSGSMTALAVPASFLLSFLLPLVAVGQSTAAPYTTGYRYDAARHVVGVIRPDPDGAGPIHYAAVRNTYDPQRLALLKTVEIGELSVWKDETVLPSAWAAQEFTVFQTKTFTYDNDGRVLSEAVSSGGANPIGTTYSVTQTNYDSLGRVNCSVVRMNAAYLSAPPVDACTPDTHVDATVGKDRITQYAYDATSHVTSIVRGLGSSVAQTYAAYTYTPDRLLETEEDANGNQTKLTYDGLDRLITQYFPSKTTTHTPSTTDFEQYGYDAVYGVYTSGDRINRTSLAKRDGKIINYQYDALNRLVVKDIPPSTTADVYFQYDLRGLQLSARFGSVTGLGITTTYDGFGRIASSTNNTDNVSRTLAYPAYDADGDRLSIVHPDNTSFTYVYDGLDRVSQVNEGASTPIVTFVYDAQARRKSVSRGGTAAITTYFYDPVSRLQTLSLDLDGAATTTNDVNFGFTYTPADQVLTRSISLGTFAYTTRPFASVSYTPNGLDQYKTISTITPTYDPNGNMTYDGSVTYGYDAENRLITATGGKTADLYYDPDGRLSIVDAGTAATGIHYLYDGEALVAEYSNSGTVLRRYVHGPGADEPLVWYEGATVPTSTRYYLSANHQGSIVAVTSSGGTTLDTYDEYGFPATNGAGTFINAGTFQYTGQIWIAPLGLYYYKARIYNAKLGRFMQTDPIGYKDDLNLYAYVGNDPENRTDPSGNCFLWIFGSDCSFWNPDSKPDKHPTSAEETDAQNRADALAAAGMDDTDKPLAAAAKTTANVASKVGDTLEVATSTAVTGVVVSTATKVAKAANLIKQLSSEEGMAEILSGGGKRIAGVGTNDVVQDAPRLVSEYGGNAGDWVKVTSTAKGRMQVHAYRNIVTGQVVELKSMVK